MYPKISDPSEAYGFLQQLFPDKPKYQAYMYRKMYDIPGASSQVAFINMLAETILSAGKVGLTDVLKYRVPPVGIKEFVTSPMYLNKAGEIYPAVLEELEEMNCGEYVEVVLTGGIGSAKTTCALYSQAYQLYLLSCLQDPHAEFGLDSASEILIVFQSLSGKLAKDLDYTRFRKMVEGSLYFRQVFPYRADIESKLIFPNRIEVVPVSGQETGAIGQNVIGGILDEVNFMTITENSKQSSDGTGVYNQAEALYNSIARRRKSRFSKQGKMPGLLCLVSSKRYPGQFTDLKTEEANQELQHRGKTRIYVYDKRVWDVKPAGSFLKEKFPIFIGDESRKPRVLTTEEATKLLEGDDSALVDWIPMDFYTEFNTDIIKALQDIAGHSTLARHPFLMNTELVAACFGKVQSVVQNEWVDFVSEKALVWPDRIVDPQFPRFAHLDLSKTGDSTGLSVGHCCGFEKVDRGDYVEFMPIIKFDVVLEVRPPKGGEILYYKIRELLYKLRELGLPIKWVSADTYQSTDMLQILRQQGFVTGEFSLDTSPLGYDVTKTALYDGRLLLPTHGLLKKEFLTLERDTKKNKIDHPATGSKDCADSVAGVVYGLTYRREVWSQFNIPIHRIPEGIKAAKDKMQATH